MKRITMGRALVAFAVLTALTIIITTSNHTVPAVYASSGCSAATLKGAYGFIQPAGFTSAGNGQTATPNPWQYVGVETFDGIGGTPTSTSANYTAAVNGSISTDQPISGTYTVNSDCTGSIQFTSGPAAPLDANIVIVDGGAEVFGIVTNNGNTATFIEKKQ